VRTNSVMPRMSSRSIWSFASLRWGNRVPLLAAGNEMEAGSVVVRRPRVGRPPRWLNAARSNVPTSTNRRSVNAYRNVERSKSVGRGAGSFLAAESPS
jgi:hypothetical protein